MGPDKLTIWTEDEKTIVAQFNPEKYTASRSVQYAEAAIPGLDAPVVQFVRGQSEKVTLELFFDATEKGTVENVTDVRNDTRKVYDLMRVNSDTHAPPRCVVYWGANQKLFSHGTSVVPWCLVESVSQEFTLFSPSGIPLRAKLNVTFRDAWTIDEQLEQTPRHTSDRTKFVRVRRGETLSHIAWKAYQNPAQWRPIAEANGLDNPRLLSPGMRLKIPSLTAEVRD
jgi:nucleoid-associated protein YgaU